MHVIYRCPGCEVPGNRKLAVRPVPAEDEKGATVIDGVPHKLKPLIETRGEGGYFLCAPSPGYEVVAGSLLELPVITPAERAVLIRAAESLTEYLPEAHRPSAPARGSERPGDVFNREGDVGALLERHGWALVESRNGQERWRRPGKSTGTSATLQSDGARLLYVFSSAAAPFEARRAYSPFAVLALLDFGGDFSAAARSLRPPPTPSGDAEQGDMSLRSHLSQWPKPVDDAALLGLAGDFVRLVGPHSEADPMALLSQLLVTFGNMIGRHAHFIAESDQHYTNLYVVLVGSTAKGRKGSSWGHISRIAGELDPTWRANCVGHGLSSGEGLIWQVRDAIYKKQPVKQKGRVVDYEEVMVDEGVKDKRLLVQEAEFAGALKVLGRDGNTLSPILRCAWDTGHLRSMTKNSPARATGAHISLIGHITKNELLRLLTSTEAGNGFGNRILWICVRRSKPLPEGGNVPLEQLEDLALRLRQAVAFGRGAGEMRRDEAARALWYEVYPALSEAKPGLLGAMIARAEAQVMRLACLYALFDFSYVVRVEHLRAALAFWDYSERSAGFVFGSSLGDPMADEVLRVVREAGANAVTRTALRDHFKRHAKKSDLDRALSVLREMGLVDRRDEDTGGRPAEVWFALSDRDRSDRSDKSPPPDREPGPSVALDAFVAGPDGDEPGEDDRDDGPPDGTDDSPHREVL